MALGRWQQVFADALTEQAAVRVAWTVQDHLGRTPTRSEITAARRAAHLLAKRGGAKIRYVQAWSSHDPEPGGVRTTLILVRPGHAEETHSAALGRTGTGPTVPPGGAWTQEQTQRMRALGVALDWITVTSREVDVGLLSSPEAETLAAGAEVAMRQLDRLARLLRRRTAKNTKD